MCQTWHNWRHCCTCRCVQRVCAPLGPPPLSIFSRALSVCVCVCVRAVFSFVFFKEILPLDYVCRYSEGSIKGTVPFDGADCAHRAKCAKVSTSRSYRSALKLLAFTRTQLVWVILAGLPEKPETADLGMGDGAEIRKLFLEEEEWWLLLLTSRGRSTPCQPEPRGCSARWMLAGRARFCHVRGPSPCPPEQPVHDVRRGNRRLLVSVVPSLLQARMVCGIVSAVL